MEGGWPSNLNLIKMELSKYLLIFLSMVLLVSCHNDKIIWNYENTIDLGKTTPIGLVFVQDKIWIADGDNNRLVELDEKGTVLSSYDNFDRPMHIATDGEAIYVPEYGKDEITIFNKNERLLLPIGDSLDAPAGIHYANGKLIIADFYNHRVLYGNKGAWIAFGKEGKENREFYYPTDVHIANQKLYVADAYNNRVQIFDLESRHLMTIGEEEKMNAATGIYVSSDQIFVTDFENDRVLIYSFEWSINARDF